MLPARTIRPPWTVDHPFVVFHRHDRRPHPLRIEAHDWCELVVILEGRREHHWGNHVRLLGPGDVALSPPWEPHAWRSTDPDTTLASAHFPPQFLGSETFDGVSWLTLFALEPEERPVARTSQARAEIVRLARELVRYRSQVVWYTGYSDEDRWMPLEQAGKATTVSHVMWPGEPELPRGWEQHVRLHCLLLLLALFQEWEGRTEAAEAPSPGARHLARLLPALHLCGDRRADSRVTLAEAAAACHLSESRFRSLFRETMRVSFGTFELRRRLGRAVDLLLTSDESILEIALASGFNDASHLRRGLLRQYQTTPAALRRGQALGCPAATTRPRR